MISQLHLVFTIALLVLAPALTGLVILQNRGSGVGLAFGGDSNVYRTRRGIEKKLHYATIVVAVIFFATVLAFSFLGA
jgi:preprotein translocase subunit SecG